MSLKAKDGNKRTAALSRGERGKKVTALSRGEDRR
jgi:hypothetical protein